MPTVFNLASPPTLAGLYLLRNNKTQEFYIGSTYNLRMRYQQWRGAGGPIEIQNHEDWDFCVFSVHPNYGATALRRLETDAIRLAYKKHPDKLLNKQGVAAPLLVEKLALSRYVVYNDDDDPIPYKAAAVVLNLEYNTLTARISGLRRKGFTRITLHDLRQRGIYSITGAQPVES